MLTGLNHITIAVNDISTSFDFYVKTLGFSPKARWASGAYLCQGDLWLCLSVDEVTPRQDYTHYAFSIQRENFDVFSNHLRSLGIKEWKSNNSEGKSIYLLDPDGHKLEIHDGDLNSRLNACLKQPYKDMVFFNVMNEDK